MKLLKILTLAFLILYSNLALAADDEYQDNSQTEISSDDDEKPMKIKPRRKYADRFLGGAMGGNATGVSSGTASGASEFRF